MSEAADVVYLADGSQLAGTVVLQEPGKFVVVRTPDGSEITVSWLEVKRVAISPRPSGTLSGAQTPALPTDPVPAVPASAAWAQHTSQPLSPPPTGTTAPLGETEIVDCSATTDSRCAGISKGLLIADRPLPVRRPRSVFLQAKLGGSFQYGHAPGIHIFGGGFEPALSVLFPFSGFPPPRGGTFHSLAVEPGFGFYGAGLVTSTGDTGAGMFMFRAGTTVGYQFWRLAEIDPYDHHQGGFGALIGYRPGYQYTYINGAISGSGHNYTHGLVLELTFPKYKTGPGKLERGMLIFAFTRMADSDLFFVSVGGAGAFP